MKLMFLLKQTHYYSPLICNYKLDDYQYVYFAEKIAFYAAVITQRIAYWDNRHWNIDWTVMYTF